MRMSLSLLGGAAALFVATSATAQTTPQPALMPDGSVCHCNDGAEDAFDYTSTLTGDWGGMRTKWAAQGLDVQATYTAEMFNNFSGGIKTGADAMDNLDVTIAGDGEKLFGLKGMSFLIYALNNNGAGFNANRVGSGEGISNIEVEEPTAKIYEAWVQQAFWQDKASLRVGLYDLNSEFNATDSSALFINPTYGIDTSYAASGANSASVFPTTSFGGRLQVQPTEDWVLQAAVLDGVPGAPDDGDGTHVDFDDKDGLLIALEAAYGELETGRVGVGGWWFTGHLDHISDVDGSGDPLRRQAKGMYGFAETTLYSPGGDRHLDGFIRIAGAPGNTSQFDYNASTGLTYTGLFASRAEDVAGIGLHMAHNSDPYLRANAGAEDAEWGVELTYAAQVLPWLNVQPDFQYIRNPGTTPGVDDAWVGGVRMGVAL